MNVVPAYNEANKKMQGTQKAASLILGVIWIEWALQTRSLY